MDLHYCCVSDFGFHSCTSFCASAIWAGVILLAMKARLRSAL